MKKTIMQLACCAFFLTLAMDVSARRIRGRSSSYSEIKLVADLPNTPDYLIPPEPGWKEDHHMDLATLIVEYGLNKTVPMWVKEQPVLVGYDQITGEYYELPDDVIDKIIEENNLDKKKLLHINFYKQYGGKIAIGALIALIIYGLIPSKKTNKTVTKQIV